MLAELAVLLSPDGFGLRALRWQGRLLRVVAVEDVLSLGFERRYRVLTAEGLFELRFDSCSKVWAVHRAPSWIGRFRARLANRPRYPLPAWRRRARPTSVRVAVQLFVPEGRSRASRFALVRQ